MLIIMNITMAQFEMGNIEKGKQTAGHLTDSGDIITVDLKLAEIAHKKGDTAEAKSSWHSTTTLTMDCCTT
jgi:hypothetical protein